MDQSGVRKSRLYVIPNPTTDDLIEGMEMIFVLLFGHDGLFVENFATSLENAITFFVYRHYI